MADKMGLKPCYLDKSLVVRILRFRGILSSRSRPRKTTRRKLSYAANLRSPTISLANAPILLGISWELSTRRHGAVLWGSFVTVVSTYTSITGS